MGRVAPSVSRVRILLGLLDSEEEETMTFRNVGNYSLH